MVKFRKFRIQTITSHNTMEYKSYSAFQIRFGNSSIIHIRDNDDGLQSFFYLR